MGSDKEFDRESYLNFMKRHRPDHFYDPKYINLGLTPGTTMRTRQRLVRTRPGNFFNQVGESSTESSLSKLFKKQADRLLELEFDKYVQVKPNVFWGHINKLAELTNTIKPRKDCIPFLIVVSRYAMNLQKQASRIGIDCADGSRFFGKGGLPNMPGVLTPELPYLAVNVSIDTKLVGMAPAETRKKFSRWWRWNKLLPSTIDEGFAIATQHKEILKNNILDLPGTQFGSNGVPGLAERADGLWITRSADDQGGIGHLPVFCYERLAP